MQFPVHTSGGCFPWRAEAPAPFTPEQEEQRRVTEQQRHERALGIQAEIAKIRERSGHFSLFTRDWREDELSDLAIGSDEGELPAATPISQLETVN